MQEPTTLEQLSESKGLEAHYTQAWLDTAEAYGIVEQEGESYCLAAGWNEQLDQVGAWSSTYVRISSRVQESLDAVFRGRALPEPALSLRLLLQDGLSSSYRWLWSELPKLCPPLEEKLAGGGKLIEFGCGIGSGLQVLTELYPQLELTGTEADYDCAREAERLTKSVIAVTTPEQSRYRERFDIAVFHRSLAACADTKKSLTRGIQCLVPGGLLIVSSRAQVGQPQESVRNRNRLGERFFYRMFLSPNSLADLSLDEIEGLTVDCGAEVLARVTDAPHSTPTLVFRKV